ncbi:MAG: hypothetical protein HOW73_38630 [Polyangiaceae bacterium]|nr:hypothetical protein [Polyangiaceae bacterium]
MASRIPTIASVWLLAGACSLEGLATGGGGEGGGGGTGTSTNSTGGIDSSGGGSGGGGGAPVDPFDWMLAFGNVSVNENTNSLPIKMTEPDGSGAVWVAFSAKGSVVVHDPDGDVTLGEDTTASSVFILEVTEGRMTRSAVLQGSVVDGVTTSVTLGGLARTDQGVAVVGHWVGTLSLGATEAVAEGRAGFVALVDQRGVVGSFRKVDGQGAQTVDGVASVHSNGNLYVAGTLNRSLVPADQLPGCTTGAASGDVFVMRLLASTLTCEDVAIFTTPDPQQKLPDISRVAATEQRIVVAGSYEGTLHVGGLGDMTAVAAIDGFAIVLGTGLVPRWFVNVNGNPSSTDAVRDAVLVGATLSLGGYYGTTTAANELNPARVEVVGAAGEPCLLPSDSKGKDGFAATLTFVDTDLLCTRADTFRTLNQDEVHALAAFETGEIVAGGFADGLLEGLTVPTEGDNGVFVALPGENVHGLQFGSLGSYVDALSVKKDGGVIVAGTFQNAFLSLPDGAHQDFFVGALRDPL